MVGTRDASEIKGRLVNGPVVDWTDGPVADAAYLSEITRAHEAAFVRVLVGSGSVGPEGGAGRAATRVITGGDEQDQRREDDFVRHDDRDGRTREALALAGRYGRTMRYSISVRPITAPAESRARERAAWIADVATRRIGEARQARTTGSVTGGLGGYGATTSAIERDAAVTTSTGRRRLIGLAASGEVHDERLWTRIAGLTGGAGNSTALVGTPDQAAEAMLRYCDLGVTTLLLRWFDPVADAVAFGEELLPRLRAGTRRRSSSRPDVSVGS